MKVKNPKAPGTASVNLTRSVKSTVARNGHAGNGHAAADSTDRAIVREFQQTIALGLIDPSPYQPRQEFPDDEIRSLADSIAAHGLLQPVLVRPAVGGHFELMEGERRVRACRLLKRETIAALVRESSDAQAREIVLLAQLQRKAFDAVEEAKAFKTILEAEGGPTQEELARRLGISQGQVSNRLRLLKLPTSIHQLVRSGDLTATQARELVPLAELPAAAKAVGKLLADAVTDRAFNCDTVGSIMAEPNRYSLWYAIGNAAPEVQTDPKRTVWDRSNSIHLPVFVPDARQRESLAPVTMTLDGQERAFTANEKLYRAMEKEHFARELDKLTSKKPGTKRPRGRAAAAADAETLTPEQQKRLAEIEQEKRKRFDRQRRARTEDLATNWMRRELATRITDADRTSISDLLALLMEAATEWPIQGYHFGRNGPKPPTNGALADKVRALLAACFWEKDEPRQIVEPARVRYWVNALSIDLAAAWKREQLGALSAALWKNLGRAGLATYCRGMPALCPFDPEPLKAGELIEHVMLLGGSAPMPGELQKCLPNPPKKAKRAAGS